MNAVALTGEAFDDELAARYELLELIGRGGMGSVVLSRHRQLGELFAIKLLARNFATTESITRFMREARAAASIRGRHVARVSDAGILVNGQPFIVMEYLRGQDLARLIERSGPLPIHDAVDYVLQALEAIAEAHSLGIIHRDLKPSNLFVAEEPSGDTAIKVLDFGLAKLLEGASSIDARITESGGVLGTPSYMSPEQFAGEVDVDTRADLWGIGVTLFELLAGTCPFSGTNIAQLYTAIMQKTPPRVRQLRPEVPAELDEAIATCLRRERKQRYASVAALALALEPYGGEGAPSRVRRIERVLQHTRATRQTRGWTQRFGSAEQAREPAELSRSAIKPQVEAVKRRNRHRRLRLLWIGCLCAMLVVAAGAAHRLATGTRGTTTSASSPAKSLLQASPARPVPAAPELDEKSPEPLLPRESPAAAASAEAPPNSPPIQPKRAKPSTRKLSHAANAPSLYERYP